MSIFGDLDLNNAPDDPNEIPDATYEAFLTNVERKPTKSGDKIGVTFTYTVSEGDYNGSKVTEWKSAMPTDDARTKGWLKQRILSLGVPPERIDDVGPEDLIGTEVYLTVKNRNGFTNVSKVEVKSSSTTSSSESTSLFSM